MRHVAVVGAGAAGTGAALAARALGARVTVFEAHAGATTLAPGVLDGNGSCGLAHLDELGLHAFPEHVTIATTAGTLRAARGHDRSVLNLAGRRGVVWVPDVPHASWDARALARAWTEQASDQGLDLTFLATTATLLRFSEERHFPDADLAARHDDPDRLGWIAERLREALARSGTQVTAIVLPPWLGACKAQASALSDAVALPCGEAVGHPGGPAGLRFEQARDLAFARRGIEKVRARVGSIRGGRVLSVDGREMANAAAAVMAIGGLVGGGVAYGSGTWTPDDARPLRAIPTLALTISASVSLGSRGVPLSPPSALEGTPPEAIAWPCTRDEVPLLERCGVLTVDGEGRTEDASLYAAGDVMADLPRTWLDAFASGVRAGRAASGSVVTHALACPEGPS